MDNPERLDDQLKVILETLKKLGDGDNEQVPSLEKYVQDEICALMDDEASFREIFINSEISLVPAEDRKLHNRLEQYSGSVVEGAMMARCFQNKEDWREFEVDVMCNMFFLPPGVSHLPEPVKDKPGFVRLHYQAFQYLLLGYQYCYFNETKRNYEMAHYISPLIFKNCLESLYDMCKRAKKLNKNSRYQQTETTIESKTEHKSLDGSTTFFTSFDCVPAGELLFWPHQAANWITRCRRWWPQQDTIQEIAIKGCQVVPRSSPHGDPHSEWRLSFSKPESILAQLRSKKQKQAYYFLKMFFYKYLKCVESSEPEGKPLYSYIMKTTMLWACEDLPPEDPIWTSLENSVQMLLFKLFGYLEVGFLRHYFIPEINLLETVGQDVISQCIAIISKWQNNILMAAPFDIPEKREFINKCLYPFYEKLYAYADARRSWLQNTE